MFCLKCGKQIDDNAMKCPYCNCPTENAGTTISADVIDPAVKSGDGFGIASIILGAISLLFAWLFAIIGWGCAGTGLALGIVGRVKGGRRCVTGIILSAIGLFFSFLSSLIGVLLMM